MIEISAARPYYGVILKDRGEPIQQIVALEHDVEIEHDSRPVCRLRQTSAEWISRSQQTPCHDNDLSAVAGLLEDLPGELRRSASVGLS